MSKKNDIAQEISQFQAAVKAQTQFDTLQFVCQNGIQYDLDKYGIKTTTSAFESFVSNEKLQKCIDNW